MSLKKASRLRRLVAWLSLGDRATAIAMALLVLYYAVTWGPWQGKASGDGWFGFLYLKAIFYHHTLDMKTVAPEYLRFFGEQGPWHTMPNRCPFGPVPLWLPLYMVVAIPESLLLWLKVLPHATWNGQSPVHVWVTGLGTLAAVLVGWRATFALLSRHTPLAAARLGALATVWATPLLWYTANQPFYQHGIAFLCIAVHLEHWDRTRGQLDNRRFVWSGLVLGYAASVRAQEIVYVLPFALELVAGALRGPNRGAYLRGMLVSGLAFLLAFAPQLLVWFYYSGHFTPVQAEPIRWREPWPLVVLFSTRAGLFPWTPLAYAGALGVVLGLGRRDATGLLVRRFGLAFLVGFYIVACAWVVPGAYAFGARRLSDAMGLVGLGLAILHARLPGPRSRRALVAFVGFCIVLNIGLMYLLRERKITSCGSATRSLAAELEQKLHAPSWLVGAAARVGWPFTQPASAIWAIANDSSAAGFETVVGDLTMERDGQWLTLISRSVDLGRTGRFHVPRGLAWGDSGPGRVTGPVRVLLHLFATEPVEATLVGKLAEGPVAARWNGVAVVAERKGGNLHLPRVEARAGANELELELPLGSTVDRLDFGTLQKLKRPTFP